MRISQPSTQTNLKLECWYVYKPVPFFVLHICRRSPPLPSKGAVKKQSKILVSVAEVKNPVSRILSVLPVASTEAIRARYVVIWLALFCTMKKAPEMIMIRLLFPSVFVSFQVGLPNAPDCGSTAAFASSNRALLGA